VGGKVGGTAGRWVLCGVALGSSGEGAAGGVGDCLVGNPVDDGADELLNDLLNSLAEVIL
jgi:hypothetical protein